MESQGKGDAFFEAADIRGEGDKTHFYATNTKALQKIRYGLLSSMVIGFVVMAFVLYETTKGNWFVVAPVSLLFVGVNALACWNANRLWAHGQVATLTTQGIESPFFFGKNKFFAWDAIQDFSVTNIQGRHSLQLRLKEVEKVPFWQLKLAANPFLQLNFFSEEEKVLLIEALEKRLPKAPKK